MWNQYKVTIISTLIGAFVLGALPASLWLHNAYADARYVQQTELEAYKEQRRRADILEQIEQIDHALFEVGQEVAFAEDEQTKAKWQARKEYYERAKQQLARELADSQ